MIYDVTIPARIEVTAAARSALQELGRIVETTAAGGVADERHRILRIRGVHAPDALGAAQAVARALDQDVADMVSVLPSPWTT